MIGFFFMIGIGGLIIFFIKIANDSAWGENQRSAVSAIANWVEALAVVGALVYAGVQLREAKEAEAKRRYAELVDRLEATVHDELQPAVERMDSAALTLHQHVRLRDHPKYDQEYKGGRRHLLVESQRELRLAVDVFDSSMLRTRRCEAPINDAEFRRVLEDLRSAAYRIGLASRTSEVNEIEAQHMAKDVRDTLRGSTDKLSEITLTHVRSAGVSAR